tara:strand:+ start:102 stop:563 length:462 start_codon:yes stop_codon:yes gene_type:complete
MPLKSFRGLMTVDAGGDSTAQVSLHTNDGSIGYRIKKLQIIPKDPTDVTNEAVFQIFTIPTASTDEIDFSDPTLLACAIWSNHSSGSLYPEDTAVIFDNMVFNQDVYLTCKTDTGSTPSQSIAMNYYFELEQIKLDLNENTVATLKDIRNITR